MRPDREPGLVEEAGGDGAAKAPEAVGLQAGGVDPAAGGGDLRGPGEAAVVRDPTAMLETWAAVSIGPRLNSSIPIEMKAM